MEWLLLALGLLILIFAGDLLVKGATNTAIRLGIPPLIVGMTIVAFGTSAPELLVSINAAADDLGGLALGNVVGSNIANILLVLGVPALIATMDPSDEGARANFLKMIGATLLFIFLAMMGQFNWMTGLVLLAVLAAILAAQFVHAMRHREKLSAEDEMPEEADLSQPAWKTALFIIAGLIGLPIGAELLVDNAVDIAMDFGVSETVIGLTLVAVGTSLPELATTVSAAIRRQADVGIGGVIGSNIFNLLFIIGAASLVAPIPVDPELLELDLWVMLGVSLLLIPFVFFDAKIDRKWGIGMTLAYIGYICLVVS